MKHQVLRAAGTFGTQEVKLELFTGSKPYLLTFFHGCCSGPYDLKPTKYQLMAPLLSQHLDINVAFYQSSRLVEKTELPPTEHATFAQKAFAGKTQLQEVKDAEAALAALVASQPDVNFKHIFVGFSLGGLMATTLLAKYRPVLVCCFASALGFNLESNTPILGGGLEKRFQHLLSKNAAEYQSHFVLVRGTNDMTSPEPNAYDFFSSYQNAAAKEYHHWKGVDHRFIEIDGEVKEAEMTSRIQDFLERKITETCFPVVDES
jgi:dienelactone hydrolase